MVVEKIDDDGIFVNKKKLLGYIWFFVNFEINKKINYIIIKEIFIMKVHGKPYNLTVFGANGVNKYLTVILKLS